MELKKGQKVDITKNNTAKSFRFRIQWQPEKEMDLDISAFLLHAGDRCLKDEHFIFYGQPQSVDGSVGYRSIRHNEGAIDIDFLKIPYGIEKIALTLTIHEGDEQDLRFRDIGDAKLFIEDAQTNQTVHEFSFKGTLEQETAVVIGELYLHNGEWKFNAVGSGFFGGLTALCENFGLQVAEDEVQEEVAAPKPPAMQQQVPAQPAPTPASPQAVATKPVSLAVTLAKSQSASIQRSMKVVATLEWADARKDLDLYCFYVLQTGESGKVYDRHLGSPSSAPYITLGGDSKTAAKETIIIHQPEKLKYVLFAANRGLSNGLNSKRMKAVIDNQMGQQVTVPFYEHNWFAHWIAIAHIDFTRPGEMVISQVERYSRGGSEKSPVLYEDGTFEMNKGPIELKK
ncbi:MAG: TerD family protein [Lysinibacillus sp.]